MAKAYRADLRYDGPKDARWTIALAHGAGVGMDAPFMEAFAQGLAHHGLRVARFEFPYMAARREQGLRRPPDRPEVLQQTWLDVIERLRPEQFIIGGKSLGGRVASLVADESGAQGLVCLGYPFHPPGKPDRLRTDHLEHLQTPTLILQGSRDPFGSKDEVAGYLLSSSITIHWLEDGEHSFKPRKASGRTEEENINEAILQIVAFVERLRCSHGSG